MSNSVDENPQTLVSDNEQTKRSSPTRRVAADQSDLELMERSQALINVLKQVDSASDSNLPVLLIGAPGTGKQLVACAIHQRSARGDQPFVAVNCGVLPADSIDAELFGVDQDRRGLWEQADGGTLFLDEITNTDSSLQTKLLQALQRGEITRPGSDEARQVDVRVIAAGCHNLEEDVKAGRFRDDLFDALRTLTIVLPPLRKTHIIEGAQQVDVQLSGEVWVPLSAIEGWYVARVLNHTGGNKQAAARVLEVDRKTLDRMIKRHHIEYPHGRHRIKASVSGKNF
jgi:DNA-binding NtrC family response regulator